MKKTFSILVFIIALSLNIYAEGEPVDLTVGAQLEYICPQGEFVRMDFDPTIGFNASLEMAVSDNFSMYGRLGYASWSNEPESGYGYEKLSILPIHVGIIYYIDYFNLSFLEPYVSVDFGYNFNGMDYISKQMDEVNPSQFYPVKQSSTSAVFGWSLNLGALIPLDDRFSIKFNIKYKEVFDYDGMKILANEYYTSTTFKASAYEELINYFTFNIGASYFL